jgi:uncharacterized protein YbaR (Trm112 family)
MKPKAKKKEKASKVKDLTCKLLCPKCREHFANLKFAYDTQIDPEDIEVLKGDHKFVKGEDLACTLCKYTYTSWDIYLAIAEAKDDEEKA